MQDLNRIKQVPISWAGRVRTGNKQAIEYVKDYDVSCRFNDNLTRENIYRQIEKTKWSLSRVVGMVLRPGGLVDFTLKSKDSAVNFAQTLKLLDSVKSATAYADSVVEVRIDFIPPGFPTEPISSYLQQNRGEVIGTPIRIADRFNIQTGTRVFKMTREDLEENPIASYLFFGKYKFRVRYTGQKTTCGYCAENDHLERNCQKKQNMITLVRNSKMERRLAKQTNNEAEVEINSTPPTHEEVTQSFEDNKHQTNEKEKKTLNENRPKDAEQKPTTQTKRDSGKRPLSDSSASPTTKHRNKRKNSKGVRDDSPSNERDPEISSGTSSDNGLSEFQLFADPCCHELIQKCTGRHFACACQKQFYRCMCGWKLLGLEKGVYKCDTCDATVANCVGCGSFQVKKKGKLFQCENCQYQLTKELHHSTNF